MGYIIWPISMVAIFGYRYIIKWYEQDRRQFMKLICIVALITSGFIFIYWGFALGMIVAGIIQLLMNMAKYAKDPEKLEAELGTEFKFGPQDIVGIILMMTLMAVVCIFAFIAIKNYLKVLRQDTTRQVSSRSTYTASSKRPEDKTAATKKAQRMNSVFCRKCGARIPEGSTGCPSCNRKSMK